jgi:hypothetical protein
VTCEPIHVIENGSNFIILPRPQHYSSETVKLALLTIFKYIVAGGSAAHYLIVVFTRVPAEHTTHIMSGVLQLWLEYADMRGTLANIPRPHPELDQDMHYSRYLLPSGTPKETFYDREKDLVFSKLLSPQTNHPHTDACLSSIIRFMVVASQASMTIRWSLLDAGALAVVLIAYLDDTMIPSNPVSGFRHVPKDPKSKNRSHSEFEQTARSSPIPLSLICSQASQVLDTMRTPAFAALLQTRMFKVRRPICLSLLHTLIGFSMGLDDMYSGLRDILENILNL